MRSEGFVVLGKRRTQSEYARRVLRERKELPQMVYKRYVEPFDCTKKFEGEGRNRRRTHHLHVIPRQEIINICQSRMGNLKQRATVAVAYLTGARSLEISRLRREDIQVNKAMTNMRVIIRTSAKRREAFPVQRTLYINLKLDKEIASSILKWLKVLDLMVKPPEYIFGGARVVQHACKNLSGHGAHCFRITALTRFVKEFGFDSHRLMVQAGWKSADPDLLDTYIQLGEQDVKQSIMNPPKVTDEDRWD